MPAQAEYLMTATETVRRTAADNQLAYNETLTVLCEQGLAGFLLAAGLTLRWRAQAWVNDYATFATTTEHPQGAVGWMLRHDPYLLDCHAEAAFLRTDYETALRQAERLDSYARTARQAMRQGECHKETGDTLKALACYQEAARMMPGLMYPAFAEFDLYRKSGLKGKAMQAARELSRFQPKVENHRTRLMREEARRYLRHGSK